MAIIPLAVALLPLIPQAVRGITAIVDAIMDRGDTPEEVKVQLEALSADLKAAAARVQAGALPDAR